MCLMRYSGHAHLLQFLRALIDTNSGFTGNEVARVSGMNPRSAFKALTSLENLGIVNRQIGGRDHIFTLKPRAFYCSGNNSKNIRD